LKKVILPAWQRLSSKLQTYAWEGVLKVSDNILVGKPEGVRRLEN
jgi:hypothetical protein